MTLWAVDYGILSLTGYATPDVLPSVWTDKRCRCATETAGSASSAAACSRRRARTTAVAAAKTAGPGARGKDFRPLAFWLGSVETDASGHATRDVTLPESLTTYRIMAVAGDSASRFGSAGGRNPRVASR